MRDCRRRGSFNRLGFRCGAAEPKRPIPPNWSMPQKLWRILFRRDHDPSRAKLTRRKVATERQRLSLARPNAAATGAANRRIRPTGRIKIAIAAHKPEIPEDRMFRSRKPRSMK